MTIEITVTCAECGADYEPDHGAYVRGDWRLCPECRMRRRQAPGDRPQHQTEEESA